jgi:hypothetical protein
MFSYTPATTDKFQFSVIFTSTPPSGAPVSQTVLITPRPQLAAETELLRAEAPLPDPASLDYLLVTESPHSAGEFLNGAIRPTFDVAISGKSLTFDAGSLLSGQLFVRFHNRPDVVSLKIYAETVTVRSGLKLPGTAVEIYTRNLRFEDPDGASFIDTTPLGILTGAAQFQDGASGQKGGDITLHAQDLFAAGATTRFIASGAPGQAAGQGRAGARKPDFVASSPLPPNAGPGPWTTFWNWGGMAVFPWPFTHTAQGWVYRSDGSQLPYSQIPFGGNLAIVYVQSDSPCTREARWCQEYPAPAGPAASFRQPRRMRRR